MTTTRRPSDERRRDILRAATLVIARDGLAGLTAARLAEAVGVTPGALYKHYASLDAVLVALALDVERALEATLPPDHLPPLDWLERFVDQRRTTVGGAPGVLRLLLSERFSTAFPAEARRTLSRAVRRSIEAVSQALVRGQARGDVRRDVEAAALAPLVLGLTQFLAFAAVAGEPAVAAPVAALRTLLRSVDEKERSRRSGRKST